MKLRNSIFIVISCFTLSFFASCEDDNERQLEKSCCPDVDSVVVAPINPNGDSELALLMRKLYTDADSLKQIIEAGGEIEPEQFIEDIENVHTANPTDPEVKTEQFTAFNQILKNYAEQLKKSPENQSEGFNQLVDACISCHQVVCPGPIKRIKKLTIH